MQYVSCVQKLDNYGKNGIINTLTRKYKLTEKELERPNTLWKCTIT